MCEPIFIREYYRAVFLRDFLLARVSSLLNIGRLNNKGVLNSMEWRDSRIDIPLSEIDMVSISLAGDEDNVQAGVANVTSYDLFNGNVPVRGGVYDARMGTTDYNYRCSTCHQQKHLCLGHPGVLTLKVPVEQPLMIAEIRRWVQLTCFSCGRPIIDMDRYKDVPKATRLRTMVSAATSGGPRACVACQAVHPKIEKTSDDYFSYVARQADGTATPLYPDFIRKVFQKIPWEVVEFMGKEEIPPTKLIISSVLVPPVSIRPSVKTLGSKSSSYHSTTTLVQNLVKINMGMPSQDSVSEADYLRASLNMRQVYFDMVLGSSSVDPRAPKRAIISSFRTQDSSSIMRRIPEKKGRLRKSLTGKSVWSMGRSTISGNNRLRPYEVGCPKNIARVLQVKETVQEFNKDWLMQFFINGRSQYPGCTRVKKMSTGSVHDVEALQKNFQLEVGDVMWRDVITGDVTYYNRQPSLARSALGVHRVIVLESEAEKTLQMNVAACEFYGADFDGDQMSVIVPSEIMARVESIILSSVTGWFISTKNSSPVSGEIQDSIIGMAEMTKNGVLMDRFHAMTMLQTVGISPLAVPAWSSPSSTGAQEDRSTMAGREVVSLLFRKYPFDFSRKPTVNVDVYKPYTRFAPDELMVTVDEGTMASGILDKASIGTGANDGVFHMIFKRYGAKVAFDMIYAVQQMAFQFQYNRGFTISPMDMIVFDRQAEDIRAIVGGLNKESDLISDKLVAGNLPPPIGMTVHQFYEMSQLGALVVPDNILNPILENICTNSNGFFRLIAHGSNGTKANLIHIMGMIGQVVIKQERFGELFGFRRTLPTFPRFATDPAASGFVANSYMHGMGSSEYFFSAMNGRYDLITRALMTAVTGYFQRKAMLCLQSIVVDNRRRCVKGEKVYSLLYGDSGFDTRKVHGVVFNTVMMSDREVGEAYAEAAAAARKFGSRKFDAVLAGIVADRDEYRKIFMRVENMAFNQPMHSKRYLPVDVRSLLKRKPKTPVSTLVEYDEMVDRLLAGIEDMPYVYTNEIQEKRRAPPPEKYVRACFLLQMHLRACVAAELHRLDLGTLGRVLEETRYQVATSFISYGIAAGVLSSQSICEPLTQYMLDSHHRSVTEATNKTGMTRVNEIYGAKPIEKEQSSEMLLRVLPEYEGDKYKVQEIANNIKFMSLRQFVRSYSVLFEPYKAFEYPKYKDDAAWVLDYEKRFRVSQPAGSELTNWCVWVEINRSAMILNSISLETIVNRLRQVHPRLFIVHTSENVPSVRVRMYLTNGMFGSAASKGGGQQSVAKVRALVGDFLDTTIRGVPGILDANVETVVRHAVVAGTGECARKTIYVIKTIGTNMHRIVRNKFVVASRALTSSVGDTFSLLGIEAARQKIMSETARFMGDRAPNLAHLIVSADAMTQTGRVTSFEAAGMAARDKTDVFSRMLIGDPIKNITDATVACTKAKVSGVAGKLILGTTPRLGTRYNRVYVDREFVEKNVVSIESVFDEFAETL